HVRESLYTERIAKIESKDASCFVPARASAARRIYTGAEYSERSICVCRVCGLRCDLSVEPVVQWLYCSGSAYQYRRGSDELDADLDLCGQSTDYLCLECSNYPEWSGGKRSEPFLQWFAAHRSLYAVWFPGQL